MGIPCTTSDSIYTQPREVNITVPILAMRQTNYLCINCMLQTNKFRVRISDRVRVTWPLSGGTIDRTHLFCTPKIVPFPQNYTPSSFHGTFCHPKCLEPTLPSSKFPKCNLAFSLSHLCNIKSLSSESTRQ